MGPASSLQFNNETSAGDLADWTTTSTSDPYNTDPLGGGIIEENANGVVVGDTITSTLSQTDIDLMNVLGWSTASSGGGGSPPPLTIALKDDTGASSTDKLTSDPTLTGTAAANATVTLSENGVTLGTATAGAGGDWTFTPTLADGQHRSPRQVFWRGSTVTASLSSHSRPNRRR